MTTSTVTSAYPASVEALLPRARRMAKDLGEIPSRNRLKRELRVGAPKADALRDALAAELAPPADPPAETRPVPEPTPDLFDPPVPAPASETPPLSVSPLQGNPTDPGPDITTPQPIAARRARRPVAWPVLVLALPAFVAIWSGWVELGELSGFGVVNPLPGIADHVRLNTAITLPIGVETYAAYALWVWLSGHAPRQARRFAKWSAIGSLAFGAAGQIAYHLMAAAGMTTAPWQITAAVSCLPVAVLGMGAALAHLLHTDPDPA